MMDRFGAKHNRAVSLAAIALSCALVLSACSVQEVTAESASAAQEQTEAIQTHIEANSISVTYDESDQNQGWDAADATAILLEGDAISVEGDGATADEGVVTISAGGTYVVSGTLDDGQIVVNADKKLVRLILNNADITCTTSAPIYVKDAEKVVIILAGGSENHIADGASYVFEESSSDEPNAAIFSKSDLTINGSGTLFVTANYRHGILSKDELKIMSGTITVQSSADGIRGRDFVAVKNGLITIDAQGDGIQSNNDEDTSKGFVLIENGTLTITAQEDGIQGETNVQILDGSISVITGGGSANGVNSGGAENGFGGQRPGMGQNNQNAQSASEEDTASAKGIKAEVGITIDGGTFSIDSADDAIHSNDMIAVNAGTIRISSGDDGIHADTNLALNGGEITIEKSYEGVESADITIGDVMLSVVASDDGINVAGGADQSTMGGRPGQNSFNSSGNQMLCITGGYITVSASGDGIDVNGSIEMSGGLVIVNGPTNNGNGALDYDGSFTLTGGTLLAAGSSGMAQAPGTGSTQNSVLINLESAQQAGTLLRIQTSQGEEIVTFAPAKQYQSVVYSSDTLKKDETYEIYCGGSAEGTSQDGLYSSATYTGGTLYQSFTISDTLTQVGSAAAGGQGGGGGPTAGGGPMGGGGRPQMHAPTQADQQSTAA